MTVRPLVFFPDPRLKRIAAPVVTFDSTLHTLTTDLLDTLRAAPGIGITGPHIGVGLRVVVLDLPDSKVEPIYINPEIIWQSEDKKQHEEGSISMPGVSAPVERPAAITFRYTDLSGNIQNGQANGLHAVCLQHEIDQLNGIFWLNRLSSLRRSRVLARYKKISRI